MSEKLVITDVIAENEFIYFCKKEPDGRIAVFKARRGRKKKEQ